MKYSIRLFLSLALMCASCGGSGSDPDAGADVTTDPDLDTVSEADTVVADTVVDTDVITDTVSDVDVDVDPEVCLGEDTVHVALTGSDSGSCGAPSSACATIGQGLANASAGDTVCVHAGTYDEGYLEVPAGVTLYSADGLLEAKIFSGTQSAVRFTDGRDGAAIDGFEVYGTWDEGAGDGLIRVHDASDITIRNTMAHDAPFDQDVIKVSGQVSGLLIEGVVAWNPAHRDTGDGTYYQEVIDIFGSGAEGDDPPPVSNVIVRGCWLFHLGDVGDWLIYSKIYAENILYENNVFGPSAGMGWSNAAVGIGTGEAGIPDGGAAVVEHAIVRNNIFVGLRGDAALAVMNSDDTWVYNNTFYGNSGSDLRSVIMFRGNSHQVGLASVFNNVFVGNRPSKGGDGTFFWVRDDLPDPWSVHDNLYFDNIATTDTPYTGDAESVYDVDPGLSDPAVPSTASPGLASIALIQATFAIDATSAAHDAGVDAVAIAGHPNWMPGATDLRWDYLGDVRPADDTWDLGVDEVE